MKTFSKALVATVATGAMAAASISPAYARHDGDGIGAGEIIAGALVIGGIAAIAASADNDRYDRDDRIYRDRYGYRDNDRFGYRDGFRRENPRSAIEMCVRAAENTASRYSYGRADVTDIRDVDWNRGGYTVKGRIAVNSMGRSWHRGDYEYGRGWGGDYRGWNSSYRGYDAGRFTCEVRYGRVVDIDFSGIRGL